MPKAFTIFPSVLQSTASKAGNVVAILILNQGAMVDAGEMGGPGYIRPFLNKQRKSRKECKSFHLSPDLLSGSWYIVIFKSEGQQQGASTDPGGRAAWGVYG